MVKHHCERTKMAVGLQLANSARHRADQPSASGSGWHYPRRVREIQEPAQHFSARDFPDVPKTGDPRRGRETAGIRWVWLQSIKDYRVLEPSEHVGGAAEQRQNTPQFWIGHLRAP